AVPWWPTLRTWEWRTSHFAKSWRIKWAGKYLNWRNRHDRSERAGNVRACLKTTRGSVFEEKAGWRGATKENIPGGSSTEEQRSQAAFSSKTLRVAGLLPVAGVGSAVTARCGDAPASPPWPQPI